MGSSSDEKDNDSKLEDDGEEDGSEEAEAVADDTEHRPSTTKILGAATKTFRLRGALFIRDSKVLGVIVVGFDYDEPTIRVVDNHAMIESVVVLWASVAFDHEDTPGLCYENACESF